jgi:hypothetical protein
VQNRRLQIKGSRESTRMWVLPTGDCGGSRFLWNVHTSVMTIWLCSPVDHTLHIAIRSLNPISFSLTLYLLMWRIQWDPDNASKWQMEFNSAFKGLNSVELLHIILETHIPFRLTWCCFCCLACAIAVWSNRSHDFCLLLVGVPAPLVCCCACWVLCPLLSSLRWEGLAVGMTFIAGGILVAEAGGCNKQHKQDYKESLPS